MGKTRVLFKNIGDINGTSYGIMGIIKDRNGKGQKRIRRGGKNTEEYTEYRRIIPKKDLKHNGVITHLEPDAGIIKSIESY